VRKPKIPKNTMKKSAIHFFSCVVHSLVKKKQLNLVIPSKIDMLLALLSCSSTKLFQMSITIKQLGELAREYHFDLDEARRFLGTEPKKRGRPAKKESESLFDATMSFLGAETKASPKALPKASPKASSKASPKAKANEEKPVAKRSPSGYNLFVKNQGVAISEAAKQWKGLSDSAREKWNKKAKAM
jgi:hypothetical protein